CIFTAGQHVMPTRGDAESEIARVGITLHWRHGRVGRAGTGGDVPSRARNCAFTPLSLRNQHRWLSRGLTRYSQWVPGGADEPGLVLHPFGSARLIIFTCAPNKTVAGSMQRIAGSKNVTGRYQHVVCGRSHIYE